MLSVSVSGRRRLFLQEHCMIRCTPTSICSWDFTLDGEGHQGRVEIDWLKEQGEISADGIRFEVQNQGMLRGLWTLNHDGEEVASAQKSSAFTRTFQLQVPDGELMLQAESVFGQSFYLERSGNMIATIRPIHAFTRRSTIELLYPDWDWPIVYFSFWLVVVMWRRNSQSSSA